MIADTQLPDADTLKMHARVTGSMGLSGQVSVSGAKNSATRLLAATTLGATPSTLTNFPTHLVDVAHKTNFYARVGCQITLDHEADTLQIDPSGLSAPVLSRDAFDVPIRTTYLIAAGQLVRTGEARIPYPGGCPIGGGGGGGRGYDLHIMVWRNLGCEVIETDDHIHITAPDGLVGGQVRFPITTVGGTENVLMCAAVAQGRTEVYNAYITPEVNDLIDFLRRMGARITVHGSSHVVIDGAGGLLDGANMTVMSDRIEALTWIVFAILNKSRLQISNVPFDSLEAPLLHLRHAGVDLFQNSRDIYVTPDCLTSGSVEPFELACGAHPGVISDMQSFFVILALAASGTSRVYDYRYPNRIAFVGELARLVDGDVMEAETGKITIHGPAPFKAGTADSTDLRGSMTAVMAALCAEGQSTITNVHMALRGYNNLEHKLRRLGAQFDILNGPGV